MGSEIQDYTFKILGIVEICGGEYKENTLQKEVSNYTINALCIETKRYVAIKIPELYIPDSGIIHRGLLVAHELAIDKTDCGSLKIGDIITKDGKITKEQELTFTITNIITERHYNNSIIEATCIETSLSVNIIIENTLLNDKVFIKKELLEAHKRIEESSNLTIKIGDTI